MPGNGIRDGAVVRTLLQTLRALPFGGGRRLKMDLRIMF